MAMSYVSIRSHKTQTATTNIHQTLLPQN